MERTGFALNQAFMNPEVCPISHSGYIQYLSGSGGRDASVAELIADLAAVYQAEIAALYAAGCRNIQIDEPGMTYLCYPPIREAFMAAGTDPDSILEDNINCLNACLKDVPADMTVGIHLCRGNFRGYPLVGGPYDPVAKRCVSLCCC
jgi:methionine synthase II (cobalamin-independent)